MAIPIWKDYYEDISTSRPYIRILADTNTGEVIYVGRTVVRPGDTRIYVKMNEICANYLLHQEINFSSAINHTLVERTFYLQRSIDLFTWYDAGSVTFQNDWSYDPNYVASRDGYSFPISLVADNRQHLIMTSKGSASVTAVLEYKDGSIMRFALPIYRTADFNSDYNDDYSHTNEDQVPGVAILNLADLPGLSGVTMGGRTWKIEGNGCHRYVLYYINAYGGWDSLLCRGNGVEADEWDRKTYNVAYDNRVQQARGVVDYVNEQKKRWTLRTGWLTDEGASRMHHLLGSTMVYLHDLQEDAILPVGITTTDAPYKTYMNEGARLVNYELQVELQQERVRR